MLLVAHIRELIVMPDEVGMAGLLDGRYRRSTR
jgi:hypothetical protein